MTPDKIPIYTVGGSKPPDNTVFIFWVFIALLVFAMLQQCATNEDTTQAPSTTPAQR